MMIKTHNIISLIKKNKMHMFNYWGNVQQSYILRLLSTQIDQFTFELTFTKIISTSDGICQWRGVCRSL